MRTSLFISMIAATGLAAAASIAGAQNAPAPARETPRPQDVDPAVNTSATPPARETPRPQDVEPRVNTSAPVVTASPSDRAAQAAGSAASSAAVGAAAPATPSSTTPTGG